MLFVDITSFYYRFFCAFYGLTLFLKKGLIKIHFFSKKLKINKKGAF